MYDVGKLRYNLKVELHIIVSVILDLSVQQQTLVEDCEVCCNPIEFRYEVTEGEITNFEAIKIQ